MLRSPDPPKRRALFICASADVPGVTVYHVAFVVRSTDARVKLHPPVAYAALRTAIWWVIGLGGTSPFALPAPLLMTCTWTGIVPPFAGASAFRRRVVWTASISSSVGSLAPHFRALSGVTFNATVGELSSFGVAPGSPGSSAAQAATPAMITAGARTRPKTFQ